MNGSENRMEQLTIVEWRQSKTDKWSVASDDRPFMFWLPVLGPTSYVLWRRLAIDLKEHRGRSFTIDTMEYLARIGIRRRDRMEAGFDRLSDFYVAKWSGDNDENFHIKTWIGLPEDFQRQAWNDWVRREAVRWSTRS